MILFPGAVEIFCSFVFKASPKSRAHDVILYFYKLIISKERHIKNISVMHFKSYFIVLTYFSDHDHLKAYVVTQV